MDQTNGQKTKSKKPRIKRSKQPKQNTTLTTTNGFENQIDQALRAIVRTGHDQFIFENYRVTIERIVETDTLTDEDYTYWSA